MRVSSIFLSVKNDETTPPLRLLSRLAGAVLKISEKI